jgi:hypothetical protein
MKIDTYRAGSEASASGNFGAGHALDEPKNERVAVGFGERANRVEDSMGFGAGVRSGRS